MTFFKLFFKNFDELWKTILKPPRQLYNPESLGPVIRSVNGKDVIRRDFNIVNERNQIICCSLFEPRAEADPYPCVIFLHGINGSRLEALPLVEHLLARNIGLFCFDFCGCGYSEGDLVTMGLNESDDVKAVVEHLRKERKISSLILWGRSMGSVTALIYASNDPNINCLILDSPYYSLEKVFEDIAKSRLYMPGFIVNGGVASVKNQIVENLGVDIFSIDLKRIAESIRRTPALFLSAEKDKVVQPYQVETLYKHYGGEKRLINVDGDHNSTRPASFFKAAIEFCLSKSRVIRRHPGQAQYPQEATYSFDPRKGKNFLGREANPMASYRDTSVPHHINKFEKLKRDASRDFSQENTPAGGFALKTHDGENRFKLQLSPERPTPLGGRHISQHESQGSLRKFNPEQERKNEQFGGSGIYQTNRDRVIRQRPAGNPFGDNLEVDEFRMVRPYSSNVLANSNVNISVNANANARYGFNSDYDSPGRPARGAGPFMGSELSQNTSFKQSVVSPFKQSLVSPQFRRAYNNVAEPRGLTRTASFAVVEALPGQNNYQHLFYY